MFVYIGYLWIFAVISVQAGKWGEWRNLNRCDALPCDCFDGQETCQKGEIIQIRNCDMSDGVSCHFQGGEGMLRKEPCDNPCPGWSDPILIECNCTSNEAFLEKRCNNPPPVPRGVKCTIEGEEGGVAMFESFLGDCNCTEEQWILFNATSPAPSSTPTSTPSIVSTTELPCCISNSSDYAYEDDGNVAAGPGLLDSDEGTTTTMSYGEMYYTDIINQCRNCTADEEDDAENDDAKDYDVEYDGAEDGDDEYDGAEDDDDEYDDAEDDDDEYDGDEDGDVDY